MAMQIMFWTDPDANGEYQIDAGTTAPTWPDAMRAFVRNYNPDAHLRVTVRDDDGGREWVIMDCRPPHEMG